MCPAVKTGVLPPAEPALHEHVTRQMRLAAPAEKCGPWTGSHASAYGNIAALSRAAASPGLRDLGGGACEDALAIVPCHAAANMLKIEAAACAFCPRHMPARS